MRLILKKVELLAPAGSFEKAKVAFLYGADAVYCGTSSLSLRTRADMRRWWPRKNNKICS